MQQEPNPRILPKLRWRSKVLLGLVGIYLGIYLMAGLGILEIRSLHESATLGDTAEINRLLAKGVAVDARNKHYGSSPLHSAASGRNPWEYFEADWETPAGHREIVEILLSHGVPINIEDEVGQTPLHWAVSARTENMPVVLLLLERGADMNLRDRWAMTPLHAAAKSGNVAAVREFLRRGAKINLQAQDGSTPLLYAAQYERAAMVDFLIREGADVNASNKRNEQTALHEAAWKNNVAIAQSLLNAGARVNGLTGPKTRTVKPTPLDIAEEYDKKDVAKLLIDSGGLTQIQLMRTGRK